MEGLGGHMGEVVPSRAFLIFFGSFSASTAYPEKRGLGNTGMGKPNMGLDFTYCLCIT